MTFGGAVFVFQAEAAAGDTVVEPVVMQNAKVAGFWHDQYRRLVCQWIPHCIRQMESGGAGEELLNLVATGEVLAGKTPSVKFKGCPWSDAYVYNTMEAISLALEIDPGDDQVLAQGLEDLRKKMEEWIPVILAAQEPSGYIHSFHDLRKKPHFTKAGDHEFYVMGYFIEMGVAHWRLTKGKDRRLFDAAIRCADHLDSVFGPAPKRTWLNGHPGLEYALCRLADAVNASDGAGKGDKYARLAQHFIRNQHVAAGKNYGWKPSYHQAERPATEMKDATGHAVRATYFYTAMSALASRLGDKELGTAADRLFDSAINRKEYLTGGVGASWRGEAFAGDYELANNGYCESCASCGMSFWTIEQHKRHGDSWPVDVQERLMYNNLLGSISADGRCFYYQNPLDSSKVRYPWHGCPCCVGNIPRTLLALKDLAYSAGSDGKTLYADHFLSIEGCVGKVAGASLSVRQRTDYPWAGKVTFALAPETPAKFTFAMRVPGRTDSALYTAIPDVKGQFSVTVNGEKVNAELGGGYARVTRTWKAGDIVELEFPMPVQRVRCDARVEADRGRVAFQRGPVVYSFEQVDNKDQLAQTIIGPDVSFKPFWKADLCGGVFAIQGSDGTVAVPNFARLNRGEGRAMVWMVEDAAKAGLRKDVPVLSENLFPLSRIRLTGGPLQAQQEQNRRYLLRLDPDRLLSRFRLEAGLKPKAEPYNGWESPKNSLDLAGHILGFYMAGAAMTVEATGDEELKRRLLYIVDELDAVQNAHGDGYALAVREGRKVFDEIASGKIDVKINPKTEYCAFINKRFEPIYTLNKVLIGLWRIHVATGSDKAKRVFLRLSDWFGNAIVEKLNYVQMQKVLDCEHASLPETFAVAFTMTGDEKYRRWARRLCHERMLAPLADGNAAHLNFHHANNEIPKYTGFERVYRITGEERLHRAMVNANHAFIYDHAWANGGNSHREHLFPKSDFETKLFMDGGPESCNSVNLLRQIEALFETEPSPDKIDFYERVLFNHLLSTHDPILGRTIYYTPPKPGASRTYSDEFDSMWCCTGTGFEAPGKYGQMVFTHAPDESAVTVQLFAPATLDWEARGVKLRQETSFPYGETSCVKVESVGKDPKFTVNVRRPCWAGSGFAVCVNGMAVSMKPSHERDGRAVAPRPPSPHVVSITREWKAGDRIDIEFPMSLRAEFLPGSKKYVAFFYGPTLLVGDLGSEGLKQSDYFAHPPASNTSSWKLGKPIPMPQVPVSAASNPACCLERTIGGPIVFRLNGSDILLKPMYDLHFSRYTMYWRLFDPKEEKAFAEASAKEAALAKRMVDSVKIGDAASEKAHGLTGDKTDSGTGLYGEHKEYHWRHASSGGFFAYRLALKPENPVKGKAPASGGSYVLVAKYCAHERGPRTFDVLVDGKAIYTENLIDNKKPGFVFTEMAIPADLLVGKKSVEVRFVPKKGNTAGGVFGLYLVKD